MLLTCSLLFCDCLGYNKCMPSWNNHDIAFSGGSLGSFCEIVCMKSMLLFSDKFVAFVEPIES